MGVLLYFPFSFKWAVVDDSYGSTEGFVSQGRYFFNLNFHKGLNIIEYNSIEADRRPQTGSVQFIKDVRDKIIQHIDNHLASACTARTPKISTNPLI